MILMEDPDFIRISSIVENTSLIRKTLIISGKLSWQHSRRIYEYNQQIIGK